MAAFVPGSINYKCSEQDDKDFLDWGVCQEKVRILRIIKNLTHLVDSN